MILPRRIRVWSLMVVVALVALTFTVAFEIMNRFQRDRLLRLQLRNYETTLGSRKHALECSAAVKAGRPYSTASRLMLLSGDPRAPKADSNPGRTSGSFTATGASGPMSRP